MTCSFFGHRTVPKEVEPILRSALIDLIEKHDVYSFYIGNHGGFDGMVRRILKDLSQTYPITYHVVLAYIPGAKEMCTPYDESETLLPDGIESVPRRFAISYHMGISSMHKNSFSAFTMLLPSDLAVCIVSKILCCDGTCSTVGRVLVMLCFLTFDVCFRFVILGSIKS